MDGGIEVRPLHRRGQLPRHLERDPVPALRAVERDAANAPGYLVGQGREAVHRDAIVTSPTHLLRWPACGEAVWRGSRGGAGGGWLRPWRWPAPWRRWQRRLSRRRNRSVAATSGATRSTSRRHGWRSSAISAATPTTST